MATSYAAYRRWRGLGGQAETLVVPDGFVWGAAMFGPIWGMVFGRWRAAAALGAGWAVAGVLAAAAGPIGASFIWLLVAYWSGLVARGLEELWLDDQDWRLSDVAIARDMETAEAMMIGRDAAVAADPERRW